MRYSNQAGFQQQLNFLRRQFLQDVGLPFGDVLSEDLIANALNTVDVIWLDRIFTDATFDSLAP